MGAKADNAVMRSIGLNCPFLMTVIIQNTFFKWLINEIFLSKWTRLMEENHIIFVVSEVIRVYAKFG
jgi:hypothetical protein